MTDKPGDRPAPPHIPAMLSECLDALRIRPGGRYIDATLGAGGHAGAILRLSSPGGLVLGLDLDREAIDLARERLSPFGERLLTAQGNFSDIARIAARQGWDSVDGILFDLGVSSMQIDTPERGFAFWHPSRLDMRMDRSGTSAYEVVNDYSREELRDIFRELGEERKAGRIASALVMAREDEPVETTRDLADLVARASGYTRGRTHPATRVFQALRIHVNSELQNLETALPAAVNLLAPGGRLVVVSYHSLEDRVVKDYFRFLSGRCRCPREMPVCRCGTVKALSIVTPKPLRPSEAEVSANRRARSARLRVAEKLGEIS